VICGTNLLNYDHFFKAIRVHLKCNKRIAWFSTSYFDMMEFDLGKYLFLNFTTQEDFLKSYLLVLHFHDELSIKGRNTHNLDFLSWLHCISQFCFHSVNQTCLEKLIVGHHILINPKELHKSFFFFHKVNKVLLRRTL